MQITQWEYYGAEDRQPVSVNPFDPNTPRRTTDTSGTSVRLFEVAWGWGPTGAEAKRGRARVS